jgi:peptide/nickel transport system substrate-binding protein
MATTKAHLPRTFLVTLAGGLAWLVTACGPSGVPSGGGPATATGTQASAQPAQPAQASGPPQRGGVFVTASPGPFTNCNTYEGNNRTTNITLDHVYETLVRYDYRKKGYVSNFDVVPWLAQSWDNPDPTTWIFHLRQTNWHDGQPFTADDVVATYQLLKQKNYTAYSTWRIFKSVEATDPQTVKFTLAGPAAQWQVMSSLGDPSNAEILPKHIIDAGKIDTACIGTGPFKIQSLDPKSKAVMVRNDNYWGKDASGQQLPYLDGLVQMFAMDRSAMQAAFASGELDMISVSTWAEMQGLNQRVPNTQVYTWPTDVTHGLIMNLGREPFSDKRVRQAINLLVDRQKLIDTAWFGKASASLSVSPSVREGWGLSPQETAALPGVRSDKTADIADAKKLLADAGYGPGGKPLKFTLTYITTFITAGMAPLVASDLKQYGIDVQLNGIDAATFQRLLQGGGGEYDMLLNRLTNSIPSRDAQIDLYTKSPVAQTAHMPDVGQNALFDQLGATGDAEKQKSLVLQIQKLVIDNVLQIGLVSPQTFGAVQPWVNGYTPSLAVEPDVTASASTMWLDKSKLPAKRKS